MAMIDAGVSLWLTFLVVHLGWMVVVILAHDHRLSHFSYASDFE